MLLCSICDILRAHFYPQADDFIEFGNSWVVAGECRPNQQSVLGIRSYGAVLAQEELRAKDKCFIIADRYG